MGSEEAKDPATGAVSAVPSAAEASMPRAAAFPPILTATVKAAVIWRVEGVTDKIRSSVHFPVEFSRILS